MLFWAYVILALPYAYRALAAGLNASTSTTLSEAARSLGARWFTVMFRVIVAQHVAGDPERAAADRRAGLGEFTIAYLLTLRQPAGEMFSISRNTENASVHLLRLCGRAGVRLPTAVDHFLRRPPSAARP